MTTIQPESLAEGLALIGEGLDHMETASTPEDRQLIAAAMRGILRTLADTVGYPQSLTWPEDPQWVSPWA